MLKCTLILGLRFLSEGPDGVHYNLDHFTAFHLNGDQSVLQASSPEKTVEFEVPHNWRDPNLKRVLTVCFQRS